MSSAFAVTDADPLLAELAELVEQGLTHTLARWTGGSPPPQLRQGLSYAIFSGGARLRPTLCLAVATAYGHPPTEAATAAAVSIELVHCASLVHDDLPCFDDADLRRGRPTVHRVFGVPLALLVGDALLVMGFAALARPGGEGLASMLAHATGPERGIIAGQAWESEPAVSLDDYHRAKTASLFIAAAELGAAAAGEDGARWRSFGEAVGRAYQAADDLLDVTADPALSRKTARRDAAHGRPNLARAQGASVARRNVRQWLDEASRAIPACPNDRFVRAWLRGLRSKVDAIDPPPAAAPG